MYQFWHPSTLGRHTHFYGYPNWYRIPVTSKSDYFGTVVIELEVIPTALFCIFCSHSVFYECAKHDSTLRQPCVCNIKWKEFINRKTQKTEYVAVVITTVILWWILNQNRAVGLWLFLVDVHRRQQCITDTCNKEISHNLCRIEICRKYFSDIWDTCGQWHTDSIRLYRMTCIWCYKNSPPP